MTLSEHQRQLVAIGACVGASCLSHLDRHLARARAIGLDDGAILRAIEDAEHVKQRAYHAVGAHARGVLGLTAERPPESRSESSCEQELVSLGSAVAANAVLETQQHLEAARAQGITDDQIASVIMLARQIQTCARRSLRGKFRP